MSCGGNITIYGLFPEDDITQDDLPTSGCDWRVYARPDCVVQDCFYLDCSDIYLPFGSLFDNTTASTWYIEYEIYSNSLSPVISNIHEESPYNLAPAQWFGLSVTTWSSAFVGSNGSFSAHIAGSALPIATNDAIVEIEPLEWLKIRLEKEVVSKSLQVTLWNLDRGQGPHTFVPPLAPLLSFPTFDITDGIMFGHDRHRGSACFDGPIRNAKLVVDGITLGDWPISGALPVVGYPVFDVSGNGNDGYVADPGSGLALPCP